MTASVSSNIPLTPPQASPMSFSGRGGEFLKMLVTGSLYQIPTFGFYRFWLITKLRRHLWANTQIEGESFEYTGTAKELLIGFLIALAILVPLYVAYFIIAFALEEQAAFASLPLILLMYVLFHFGSYRARKYRATRTVFRGVRFWMKGSGWAYAFRAVLWDVATLFTLGIALPWAMASLERYRMRHTYFGSIQGDFAGTGWSLFKRAWWVWVLGIAVIAGVVATSAAVLSYSEGDEELAIQFVPTLLILVLLALSPVAMAIFTRWQINGLRFGEVTAESHLRTGTFYSLFFKVLFSSIGILIVFAIIIGLAAVFLGTVLQEAVVAMQLGEFTWTAISLIVFSALVYLAFFLSMGVIQRYFYGRGLWAAVVTTTAVSNLRSLDAAVAAGKASGVVGEGLADALDFNVGI
ncbi:DUF898 family protein [Microvirga sp. KLBC 81]|uniref:DUF898 family protein n=1 Tax=Microvirga sp. KLBC 81 TaxID=1862707 RepID=UPI001403AB96|nr:DUF898 family protein [Microvirga sp. KLBC 81]